MKNILVTGANGFVGRHLVKELAENGMKVFGVGGLDIEDKMPHVTKYLQLDLNNPHETRQIDFRDIDGVIHLAGLAAVGASFDNPMKYINTNIGIQVNLFEAAIAQNSKPRFLIISSGNLYSPNAPLPLTEKSLILPSSPYAVSKIGQEQMGMYYHNRGLECIIARSFNHFGPGQGPGFIVPDLAKQIIEIERGQKNKIKVGNLDAKRDYTDVRDIARAYRLLIEKGTPGEIYNVCSGTTHSGDEILNKLISLSIVKPEIVQDESMIRPADNPVVYGSHDKLFHDTAWKPSMPLESTLSDVIKDWRNRN